MEQETTSHLALATVSITHTHLHIYMHIKNRSLPLKIQFGLALKPYIRTTGVDTKFFHFLEVALGNTIVTYCITW